MAEVTGGWTQNDHTLKAKTSTEYPPPSIDMPRHTASSFQGRDPSDLDLRTGLLWDADI